MRRLFGLRNGRYTNIRHAIELRSSGDLFYTWQYDIRWAATTLRKEGIMKDASLSEVSMWELSLRTN